MGRLENRIAIVTGAGSGLGRSHALALAEQGAAVIVNDIGTNVQGKGVSAAPAERVVAEVHALGGRAVASHHDISDWEQAGELIAVAVDAFGGLDVLVNNAGILADRTLANMTAADWDAVIRVHLTGHAATSSHAMSFWRGRAKEGDAVKASVVHTISVAGLCGNFGQANYSAAKAGIVALSKVISLEGHSIGVRSNAVSPAARTRMAASVPGSEAMLAPPENDDAFDWLDPANVSPLVAWLAEADCPADDQVFHVVGNRIFVVRTAVIEHTLVTDGRWTAQALDDELTPRLVTQSTLEEFFEGFLPQLHAPAGG